MRRVLIIGIRGKRESGKDTLGAAMLPAAKAANYIVCRRAFGDALKEEVAEFLSRYNSEEIFDFLDRCEDDKAKISSILDQTFKREPEGWWERFKAKRFGAFYWQDFRGMRESLLADMHHRAKKEQFRILMQWWGTEYRREQFGDDYWFIRVQDYIDAVLLTEPDKNILFYIPDIRFFSEVNFVQGPLEGYAVSVERPTHDIGDVHVSEIELDGYRQFNMTVLNTKTLEDLQAIGPRVFFAAQSWKWGNEDTPTK